MFTEAISGVRSLTGGVLRATRRVRGWKVETLADFRTQVHIAAAAAESHPHLRTIWKAGRGMRITVTNVMMQELLHKSCGQGVIINCMTDDVGAIGEAYLGYWIVSFRIELDRRKRRDLIYAERL
jgi:hypothetical protein